MGFYRFFSSAIIYPDQASHATSRSISTVGEKKRFIAEAAVFGSANFCYFETSQCVDRQSAQITQPVFGAIGNETSLGITVLADKYIPHLDTNFEALLTNSGTYPG